MSLKLSNNMLPSPIKEGDTLYPIDGNGNKLNVDRVNDDGALEVSGEFYDNFTKRNRHYKTKLILSYMYGFCTSSLGHIGRPCIFCGQFTRETK